MEICYIGSSSLSIDKVEYNHRNAYWLTDRKGEPYYMSTFRKQRCVQKGEGKFVWLIKPKPSRNQDKGETIEQWLIQQNEPIWNDDMTPRETSDYRGRSKEKKFYEPKNYGVYAFVKETS